jgi:hypothetical protein
VIPLEFNGREDSVFHPYSAEKKQFMEYVDDHGTFADIPVDEIILGWEKIYGQARVRHWIEGYEQSDSKAGGDFDREEII